METGKMELREAVIRTIAMPSDTNPAGDIFGGWLMAQMDLAAGNAAARRARGRCVTVAVDGVLRLQPCPRRGRGSRPCRADLDRADIHEVPGRVWRRPCDGDEQIKVTEAVFTFVAIDSGSRPRPLPTG